MSYYSPDEFSSGRSGRLSILLFEYLNEIAFHFIQVIFPAKPAQEFQGGMWRGRLQSLILKIQFLNALTS